MKPTDHSPLLHAGRALFAALMGDETGLHGELVALCAADADGRHRRWVDEEAVFAPFRATSWFKELIGQSRR
jgi:hypothetical protein